MYLYEDWCGHPKVRICGSCNFFIVIETSSQDEKKQTKKYYEKKKMEVKKRKMNDDEIRKLVRAIVVETKLVEIEASVKIKKENEWNWTCQNCNKIFKPVDPDDNYAFNPKDSYTYENTKYCKKCWIEYIEKMKQLMRE